MLTDLRTGIYCCYQPTQDTISWDFGTALPEPKEEHQTTDAVSIAAHHPIGPPVSQFLSGQTEFVGRDTESHALRILVDRALAGNGAIIMLGGGPGVGKTRLATETAAYATSRGFQAFIGHCYERDEPHPYLPFVEIVETMLAQSGPERFAASMDGNAAELARLLRACAGSFPIFRRPRNCLRRKPGAISPRAWANIWRVPLKRGRYSWCWTICIGRRSPPWPW